LAAEGLLSVYQMVAAGASERAESFLGNGFRVGTIFLSSNRRILAADAGARALGAELVVALAVAPHYRVEEGAEDGESEKTVSRRRNRRKNHRVINPVPGKIYVVGIGPGAEDYIPPNAAAS